ncbi:MAG: hypothetical protein ABR575_01440, partial [Actinomycetota bacterium]
MEAMRVRTALTRRLTPLLAVGLALTVAGSLIAFSLVAQDVAPGVGSGRDVRAEGVAQAVGRPITLAAPTGSSAGAEAPAAQVLDAADTVLGVVGSSAPGSAATLSAFTPDATAPVVGVGALLAGAFPVGTDAGLASLDAFALGTVDGSRASLDTAVADASDGIATLLPPSDLQARASLSELDDDGAGDDATRDSKKTKS